MIRAAIFAAAFAAVFWRKPSSPPRPEWPASIPAFADASPAFVSASDRSATVSCFVRTSPDAVISAAKRAFASDGWTESPARAPGFALFVRGGDVAAVLAEAIPDGTVRVTVVQRHGF